MSDNEIMLSLFEEIEDSISSRNVTEAKRLAKACFEPLGRFVAGIPSQNHGAIDFKKRLLAILESRNVFFPVQILVLKPEEIQTSLDKDVNISDTELEVLKKSLRQLHDVFGDLQKDSLHFALDSHVKKLSPSLQRISTIVDRYKDQRSFPASANAGQRAILPAVLETLKIVYPKKKFAASPKNIFNFNYAAKVEKPKDSTGVVPLSEKNLGEVSVKAPVAQTSKPDVGIFTPSEAVAVQKKPEPQDLYRGVAQKQYMGLFNTLSVAEKALFRTHPMFRSVTDVALQIEGLSNKSAFRDFCSSRFISYIGQVAALFEDELAADDGLGKGLTEKLSDIFSKMGVPLQSYTDCRQTLGVLINSRGQTSFPDQGIANKNRGLSVLAGRAQEPLAAMNSANSLNL